MNNKEKNIVPQLRFPEFVEDVEWNIDKFSSFIKLYRGSSPRPISQFLTKDENGVNWIKIGDTKNAVGFEISKVEEKITKEGSKKSRKVKKGELILANSMSYGATYELKIEGCIYDGWFVLREYEDSFDKQFLLQLLNSDFLQIQYKRLAAGGIVQNISSEIVYNTLLPKFSIKEQQKIAACLSSLDEVINAETEKLELLQDHKKGLLQQLFPQEGETQPKYRFPEFKNDGDWKSKQLDSLCKFVRGPFGGALKKEIFVKEGFAVYEQSQAIYNQFEVFRYFITKEKYEELKRFAVKANDIIMSCSGTMGKFSIVPNNFKKGVINQALLKLTVKEDLVINFIKISLELPQNQNKLLAQSAGGAIKNVVGVSELKKIKISVPSLEEQQKIADCLSSVDSLIDAQTIKVKDLQTHKKGLLQQLLPNINGVAE